MRGHQFGISAVDIPAGRFELCAEVFISSLAELAQSARGEDPCDANPLTKPESTGMLPEGSDRSHNLMSKNYGKARWCCPPLDFIQFRMANPAR
jgi:hypothetical protein